ncbi:MAG: KdsC family phosphatase [Candidatus Omnitrophota bacterium]
MIHALAATIRLAVFDFDGVFTDNRVLVLQDGTEAVFCNRSDGLGLGRLIKNGIETLVLSKETNPVVSARCRKLALPCIQSCDNKRETLLAISKEKDIPLSQIAYVGNDINDIECLEIVGFPVCVADAYPEVKPYAKWITTANGGYGAVREFCDLILNAKNKS